MFLNLQQKPARLTAEETGWMLGFEVHEIAILTSAGMLRPLGHPTRNAIKSFSGCGVERIRIDERWLNKATDLIQNHWRSRNRRGRKPQVSAHDRAQPQARLLPPEKPLVPLPA